MKLRKPDYYDQFRCIAGNCKDSCCIGWEIDIDEEKLIEYEHVKGPLGQRLKQEIDWENGCFHLQGEKERCPFLNDENLCELILELGEESLCEICREHPRFYDWFDDLTETGLGLCCEAAARLILNREYKDRFLLESDTESGDVEAFEEWPEMLFQAREAMFSIIQDRQQPIFDRCRRILKLADELQSSTEAEEPDPDLELGTDLYGDLVHMCRNLEPIDETWTDSLERLELLAGDPELLEKLELKLNTAYCTRDHEYEHLLVYFIYRHFMKCRFDGNLAGRVRFSVFCLLLIRLLDLDTLNRSGELTEENRVQNARTCSREIEYSEENTERLLELLSDTDFFDSACPE